MARRGELPRWDVLVPSAGRGGALSERRCVVLFYKLFGAPMRQMGAAKAMALSAAVQRREWPGLKCKFWER